VDAALELPDVPAELLTEARALTGLALDRADLTALSEAIIALRTIGHDDVADAIRDAVSVWHC
jgi:hypothetical protein